MISLTQLLVSLVLVPVLLGVMMTGAGIYTFYERKVAGWVQLRYGPNRTGPLGYLQFMADGIKFFLKEDVVPAFANRAVFILAPAMIFVPALLVFTVIPFGKSVPFGDEILHLQIFPADVGVLFILAVASLGVYGIVFGGWASNSKYSLLGGLRASAQMISYELSMGLAIVTVVLLSGSFNLHDIIGGQAAYWFGVIPKWNALANPLAFFVFLITMFAETNRLPFDFAEAEQELVGGYHTEYSSMKFALFFLGEYLNMMTLAMLLTVFFLGGWHFPGIELITNPYLATIASIGAFAVKTVFFCFLYIWVRWTLPRLRYDQLMGLGWKVLLPLALLACAATAVTLAI